jgi:hypothetical protein
MAWGARGRVFESLRPDQWNHRLRPAAALAFFMIGKFGKKKSLVLVEVLREEKVFGSKMA